MENVRRPKPYTKCLKPKTVFLLKTESRQKTAQKKGKNRKPSKNRAKIAQKPRTVGFLETENRQKTAQKKGKNRKPSKNRAKKGKNR